MHQDAKGCVDCRSTRASAGVAATSPSGSRRGRGDMAAAAKHSLPGGLGGLHQPARRRRVAEAVVMGVGAAAQGDGVGVVLLGQGREKAMRPTVCIAR